jgi:WW domain
LLENSVPRVALNSLAAAYVLTREPVNGTVATTDVRASIGTAYIVCMLLPLLFILPLLGFVARGAPPVPRSVWDILVLAKDDDDIPRRDGSYYSYPPNRRNLAFGITVCEKDGGDKLGLGKSFVPLTHPLPKQQSDKMSSESGFSRQVQPIPPPPPPSTADSSCKWTTATDPTTGRKYYYHIETRQTCWTRPPDMVKGKSVPNQLGTTAAAMAEFESSKKLTTFPDGPEQRV